MDIDTTTTLSLDHLFTFDGHGEMSARTWMKKGGTTVDFERDEVEHSHNCWCFEPRNIGNPPF